MNFKGSLVLCILVALSIVVAQQPLDVSITTKTVSLSNKNEGSVKVSVTDASGKFASKAKVVLLKAYPTNNEENVLVSNKELSPVAGDQTTYQYDFVSAKPEPGSYTLELKVVPEDKKFSTVDNTALNVKVVGPVSVTGTQVTVSDSEDSQDIAAGKKYKVEFGKKLDTIIKAENFQHITVEFKVGQSSSTKNIQVHQAFLRLTDASGKELIQPAKYSAKTYDAHFSVRELANEFYGQSGKFEVQLIIGDQFVSNPSVWSLGTLSLNFPNTSRVELPSNPFAKQPEIIHQFRKPDQRPPKTISLAFTAATLAIPALVLFFGLIRVGANLKNFPTGANFIFAVGFQASLGAILALFVLYWLRLNMVQTLSYLGFLTLPTLFFAHRNLNALSKVKQHTE